MNRIMKIITAITGFMNTYCAAIPVIFAAMLFIHPVSIYIPEWRFDLLEPYSPLFFLLICIVWRYCTPYRRSVRRGTGLSTLYYIVPVELMVLLVFAQHNSLFAGILLILACSLSVGFRFLVHRDETKTKATKEEKKENRMICRRFFVIVLSVTMLIPASGVLFFFGFSPPVYTASEDGGHAIYEGLEDLPARERPTLPDELVVFIDSSGDEYTPEQKLDLLQKLADYETFCLGCGSVQVVSKRLEEGTMGTYRPGQTYITVDQKHLNSSPTASLVRTMLHEVYHSYQFYVIMKTDWKSELAKSEYFDKAYDWAKNLMNYKNGYNDYDAYSEQPLEADAAQFARAEWIKLREGAGLKPS